MKSMTGCGQAICECGDASVLVELTSLNSRYCDVQVKLPRELGLFEPRVIRFIKNRFARGKFYIKVSIEKKKEPEIFQLNMEKVRAYVNTLSLLKKTFGLKDDVSLFCLVRPGIYGR